jgi:nucleoside-diphosphate-sugar epimerase
MRFLVTGATSGLGRNAVEWLLKQGHQVHATGRNNEVGKQLIALGATFTQLDLVTASKMDYHQLLRDCDIVWHCAALSSPWGNYEWFYQANVLVTSQLADIAGQLGIKRFIHVSTPSIYFDFKSHHHISEEYRAKRFANHYAETKYQAEQHIQTCVTRYRETVYLILRPRGIFGPYDRVIIPRMLALLKRTGGILYLPAGGQAYLDLTFVLNVVYALFVASTQHQVLSGEAFNITNQQPCQLNQLLKALLTDQLQLDYKIRSLPYPLLYGIATVLEGVSALTHKEPLLTRYSVGTLYFDMTLSQQQAIERLGYQPLYDLNESIALTARWLQESGMV